MACGRTQEVVEAIGTLQNVTEQSHDHRLPLTSGLFELQLHLLNLK